MSWQKGWLTSFGSTLDEFNAKKDSGSNIALFLESDLPWLFTTSGVNKDTEAGNSEQQQQSEEDRVDLFLSLLVVKPWSVARG